MDIIQQAQADTNGCSHKHNAGGQLHHPQLYFVNSLCTVLDQAHEMMDHPPAMSERVAMTAREHVNQQN